MATWGLVPAAGAGTRIQPLAFSKELLPLGARQGDAEARPRAVGEFIVERFVAAGADRLCFVIAPGKSDIVQYFGGAVGGAPICYVLQDRPSGLCDAVFRAAMLVHPDDRVFIGLPDTVWFPIDALRALPEHEVALLLFPVQRPALFDAVVTRSDGSVVEIQVKVPNPTSSWVWGAIGMPGHAFLACRRCGRSAARPTNTWAAPERVDHRRAPRHRRARRRRLCRRRHGARLSRGAGGARRCRAGADRDGGCAAGMTCGNMMAGSRRRLPGGRARMAREKVMSAAPGWRGNCHRTGDGGWVCLDRDASARGTTWLPSSRGRLCRLRSKSWMIRPVAKATTSSMTTMPSSWPRPTKTKTTSDEDEDEDEDDEDEDADDEAETRTRTTRTTRTKTKTKTTEDAADDDR